MSRQQKTFHRHLVPYIIIVPSAATLTLMSLTVQVISYCPLLWFWIRSFSEILNVNFFHPIFSFFWTCFPPASFLWKISCFQLKVRFTEFGRKGLKPLPMNLAELDPCSPSLDLWLNINSWIWSWEMCGETFQYIFPYANRSFHQPLQLAVKWW